MNTKKIIIRQIASVLVIAIFLLTSLATDLTNILGGQSTNTTVAIKNCEERPAVSGTLHVTVLALDTLDQPVPGVKVDIYMTHQKVRPDTCAFDVIFNAVQNATTGPDGQATYIGPDWIHDNSQDLFRVELSWGGTLSGVFPQPRRQIQVKYYSTSDFSFVAKQLPRL